MELVVGVEAAVFVEAVGREGVFCAAGGEELELDGCIADLKQDSTCCARIVSKLGRVLEGSSR